MPRKNFLSPLLLVPALVLLACAKSEPAASDSVAVVTPAPAPAPAALTAAEVSGKWNGATMPADRDTVLGRWTIVSSSDSTATLTFVGAKGSVRYTTRFDADSLIATSAPYVRPDDTKRQRVVFHSVGRLRDGKLVGTVTHTLASKPDSIVDRARWEASRAQ